MTVDVTEVFAALETHLKEMDAAPYFPTQWANTKFTPTTDVAYQKVDILLADPLNPEQGGTFFQDRGFMQVTLRYPMNKGRKDVITRAQAIRNRFPCGLSLDANGVTVTIDHTPTISQGAEDGDRYAVPVKIRFYANNS